MAGRQVEFDEMQTHDKKFERRLVAVSVLMIIFTVICIQVVG